MRDLPFRVAIVLRARHRRSQQRPSSGFAGDAVQRRIRQTPSHPFRQLGDLGVLRDVFETSRRRARTRGFAPPAFAEFAFSVLVPTAYAEPSAARQGSPLRHLCNDSDRVQCGRVAETKAFQSASLTSRAKRSRGSPGLLCDSRPMTCDGLSPHCPPQHRPQSGSTGIVAPWCLRPRELKSLSRQLSLPGVLPLVVARCETSSRATDWSSAERR